MRGLISFISGLLFALGLGISGMTRPQVVKGFLDVFGNWDWRLIGVMVGAIGVHSIAYQLIKKKERPVYEEKFHLPNNKKIDTRLIMGAILFGLGWGWSGICPGPALVSLASGQAPFFFFIGAMLLGMKSYQMLEAKVFSRNKE